MSGAAYLRAFGSYASRAVRGQRRARRRATGTRRQKPSRRPPEFRSAATLLPINPSPTLGLAAAQDCLTRAGVEASAVGLILFAPVLRSAASAPPPRLPHRLASPRLPPSTCPSPALTRSSAWRWPRTLSPATATCWSLRRRSCPRRITDADPTPPSSSATARGRA